MPRAAGDWLVGSPAPPLDTKPQDDGDRVALDEFRGRPVLVSFLSHAA